MNILCQWQQMPLCKSSSEISLEKHLLLLIYCYCHPQECFEIYYEVGAGLNEASQSSRAGDEGEYSSPSQCQPLCYMFVFCFKQACVVFCAVLCC